MYHLKAHVIAKTESHYHVKSNPGEPGTKLVEGAHWEPGDAVSSIMGKMCRK